MLVTVLKRLKYIRLFFVRCCESQRFLVEEPVLFLM